MFTTLFIVSSLIYIALGGALYMIRGGGFGDQYSDIATWLKNHNLPSIRNVFIVGLFLMPLVTLPYLLLNGVHGWYLVSMLGALAAGYVGTLVWGWSQYYSMGTNTTYYQNHNCIAWIDWVLFKLYGPMWIPTGAVNPDPVGYDLIPSPTGAPNSYSWLRTRSITGMALRMVYSIILFGLIGFVRYHFMGDVHGAILASLMTLPFMLTSFIYAYFVTPNASSSLTWRFESPIGRSEMATGIWLNLLLIIAMLG